MWQAIEGDRAAAAYSSSSRWPRALSDGFRPDRYEIAGAVISLVGVALIMHAPRGASCCRVGMSPDGIDARRAVRLLGEAFVTLYGV